MLSLSYHSSQQILIVKQNMSQSEPHFSLVFIHSNNSNQHLDFLILDKRLVLLSS